jgi:phosphopantetheinyl transferase
MTATGVLAPPRVGVYIADIGSFNLESLRRPSVLEQLSSTQRQELAAMVSPKRRGQFVASRVLVRRALLAWGGGIADGWTLAAEASGRPYVRSHSNDLSPPAISLSHSGRFALCALCDRGRIGVDVEEMRLRDIDGLAREAFAPTEIVRFEAQAAGAGLRAFYQLWTLKEACSKALGTGLATPFRQLVFDVHARRIQFQSAAPGERGEFLSFAPAPGTVAALALLLPVTSDPLTVRFHFMTAFERMDIARPEILSGTSAIASAAG